jgi:hypothetical protein
VWPLPHCAPGCIGYQRQDVISHSAAVQTSDLAKACEVWML